MSYPILDLDRSTWDPKKSDRKKGEYVITNPVYYKNKDFQEGHIHPYKLKWCKYSQYDRPHPYASLHEWQRKFKAELVTIEDNYWPEGIPPDADGKYVNGDLVLVKIPIDVHIAKRKEAVSLAERKAKSVKDAFKADMKGRGADIPDEWIDDELERMQKESRIIGV